MVKRMVKGMVKVKGMVNVQGGGIIPVKYRTRPVSLHDITSGFNCCALDSQFHESKL